MDIEMPKMNGIEATAKVKSNYPQIKIIMLTVFDDEDNIFKAIQAGADGYLLKDENASFLHKGILEIVQRGAPMSPQIAFKALKLLRPPYLKMRKYLIQITNLQNVKYKFLNSLVKDLITKK